MRGPAGCFEGRIELGAVGMVETAGIPITNDFDVKNISMNLYPLGSVSPMPTAQSAQSQLKLG